MLEVRRAGDTFTSRQRALADTPRLVYKAATIDSSLFAATDGAGIPDAIALQLVRIFGTDIDFHVDLRKGDRSLEQVGMELKAAPRPPQPVLFIKLAAPRIPQRWTPYLGELGTSTAAA